MSTVSYTSLIDSLGAATQSIQARPDYTSTSIDISGAQKPLTALVEDYGALRQSCLTAASGGPAPAAGALAAAGQETQALTNANIAQMNMGQLSTARKITPDTAKEQNTLLSALNDALMTVSAQLAGGSGGQTAEGWVTGILIEGMTALSATAVRVPYSKGGSAAVSAETLPPPAASTVKWTGVTGTPPKLPTGTVTPPSRPVSVTATLGENTAGISVFVVPALVQLTVSGAPGTSEPGVYDISSAKQVTLTAVTDPDTPDAWAYLQWSGGTPAANGKSSANQRVIDVSSSPDVPEIPVSAWIAVPSSATPKDTGGKP